jgi:hypothetical protein
MRWNSHSRGLDWLSSAAMTTGGSSISLGETADRQFKNVRHDRMEPKITSSTNERLGPMRCPECCTRIEVRHTHYPYFACPNCKTEICVAASYLLKLRVVTGILAFAAAYLTGFRGLPLILIGAVASLVVASIATPLGLVVLPPMIERHF